MMWLSTLTDHIQAGTLHPIAVTTLERWKQFPDTPTFASSASRATRRPPGSHVSAKGAPREITDKLTAALTRRSPIRRCASGSIRSASSRRARPDRISRALSRVEIDKWADILRSNKDAD